MGWENFKYLSPSQIFEIRFQRDFYISGTKGSIVPSQTPLNSATTRLLSNTTLPVPLHPSLTGNRYQGNGDGDQGDGDGEEGNGDGDGDENGDHWSLTRAMEMVRRAMEMC